MEEIQGGHCPCSKIQGVQPTTLPPPCRAPGLAEQFSAAFGQVFCYDNFISFKFFFRTMKFQDDGARPALAGITPKTVVDRISRQLDGQVSINNAQRCCNGVGIGFR